MKGDDAGDKFVAVLARDDFGPRRFIHATRLLVVPRSMPTTLSCCQTRSGTLVCRYQIRDVFPAVQQAAHGCECFAACVASHCRELLLHFGVELSPHAFEALLARTANCGPGIAPLQAPYSVRRLLRVTPAERLSSLLADIETFEFQKVFGACDRIAQRAIGIVQNRRLFFGPVALGLALTREADRDEACGSARRSAFPDPSRSSARFRGRYRRNSK